MWIHKATFSVVLYSVIDPSESRRSWSRGGAGEDDDAAAAAQKVRHYDQDGIRAYLRRQRADRARQQRQLENEKRLAKLMKQQQLAELDRRRRQALQRGGGKDGGRATAADATVTVSRSSKVSAWECNQIS